MSSGTLSKSMLEAQQAYIDGNFLEAHSLFLDLAEETRHRGFSLLNCLCKAYLLLTECKTEGRPKIIEKRFNALTETLEDLGDTIDSKELSKELNFIGSELLSMKKYPEAIVLLKAVLKIAKATKRLNDLRIGTYNLGYAYLGDQKPIEGAKLLSIAANLEDDFLEAEKGIRRSIEIYSKIKAMNSASALLSNSLDKWKDNEAAIKRIHYLKAELGKKNIAQVAKTDSPDLVRSIITETLEFCEKAGDGKLLCETLYQAGVALDTLEEPEREDFWKKARSVSLRFSAQDVYIRSSVSLAFLAIDGGRPAEAKPLLEDALGIAQDLGSKVMVERIKGILSSVETILPTSEEYEQPQEDAIVSVEEEGDEITEALLDAEITNGAIEPKQEIFEEDSGLPRLPRIPAEHSQFGRIDSETANETTPSEVRHTLTTDDESPKEEIEETPEITRETIGHLLTSNGYSVNYDQLVDDTTVIDIVATKGKRRRKQRFFILFSETPGDAKIGSFLLNRLDQSGKKLIFLTTGSSAEVGRVGKGIKVITDLSELEKL